MTFIINGMPRGVIRSRKCPWYTHPGKVGCPYAAVCGTATTSFLPYRLVEVTDSCNLRCPVCYAGSGPRAHRTSIARHDRKMLDAVGAETRASRRGATLRARPRYIPIFFTIVKWRRGAADTGHLMVNTPMAGEGTQIAQDDEFS